MQYQQHIFVHRLSEPKQSVCLWRKYPWADLTAEELEAALTSVSGVPTVEKHECWWVSGDFCVRAIDAPIYRAFERADNLKNWDEDVIQGVKSTGWVVMYDTTKCVHLCELTPSYELELLYPFCSLEVDDEYKREQILDAQHECTQEHVTYVHCRTLQHLQNFVEEDGRGLRDHPGDHDDARKTREQEWEQQREAWTSNCPI